MRDANDEREVLGAFDLAVRERGRPTLIIVESHIGYGAPHKQDTAEAHGEPLGEEEVQRTKRVYGWPEDAQVPRARRRLRAFRRRHRPARRRKHADWRDLFDDYQRKAIRSLPTQFDAMQTRELPDGWDQESADSSRPTRRAWPAAIPRAQVLNAIAKNVPWLIGGAADLAPSTKTLLTFAGAGDFSRTIAAAATCTSAFASMPWAPP